MDHAPNSDTFQKNYLNRNLTCMCLSSPSRNTIPKLGWWIQY